MEDCLFCKIIAGEIDSKKVYESDTVFAFRDINPVAPTHILIIPKKHIVSLATMEEDDKAILGELMYATRFIAEQEGVDEGFRVLSNSGKDGGQLIMHLHFHLIGGRKLKWPPG